MADPLRDLVAGATAGFAATAPMTAVMDGVRRLLPAPDRRTPLPPHTVTMRAAGAAGVKDELPEEAKAGLTTAAHFGFGAAAGAVYGLAGRHLPLPPVASGITYGLAVWAGSYMGFLPALRLHPHAADEPAGRVGMNVAAHVAWGATLGLLTDLMVRHDHSGERDYATARWDYAGNPAALVAGG